MRNQQKLLY